MFEMLVERLTNIEQSNDVLKEIKKVEQENAPSGSELCGLLYRRGSMGKELTIFKNYSGRLESGSLLSVTLGDDWNGWNGWTDWWTCTPGWSLGGAAAKSGPGLTMPSRPRSAWPRPRPSDADVGN